MKKKILGLLLSIPMLCLAVTGCSGVNDDGKISKKESENIFSAYKEFYDDFYDENSDFDCRFDFSNMPGYTVDFFEQFESVAKIYMNEDNFPEMVIADLELVEDDTMLYDLYFLIYDKGEVVERCKIKNLEVYDDGFVVKNIDGNIYIETFAERDSCLKLTDDDYKKASYDYIFNCLNFTDYVMEADGRFDIDQKLVGLNGKDFEEYLEYLEGKEINNIYELDELHKKYLVENRFCNTFTLNYYDAASGYPYKYLTPETYKEELNSVESTESIGSTESMETVELVIDGYVINKPTLVLELSDLTNKTISIDNIDIIIQNVDNFLKKDFPKK